MTPKKPKKPTTAELLQQLIAQVAELRGRIERLESRGPTAELRSRVERLESRGPQAITVYREPEPKPVWWRGWFGG